MCSLWMCTPIQILRLLPGISLLTIHSAKRRTFPPPHPLETLQFFFRLLFVSALPRCYPTWSLCLIGDDTWFFRTDYCLLWVVCCGVELCNSKATRACPRSLAIFPFLHTHCCIVSMSVLCVCAVVCVLVCSWSPKQCQRIGVPLVCRSIVCSYRVPVLCDFIKMLRKVIRFKSQSVMRVQSTMVQSTVLCSPLRL